MDDDIFDEDGALSISFLLSRGYCCGNGCRNCPYVPRHGAEDSRPPTADELCARFGARAVNLVDRSDRSALS